jgi:hypothetical protein
MSVKLAIAIAVSILVGGAGPKMDSDTAEWWRTTGELSNDAMEGRDTGSAAYLRAAKLVAARLEAAGLKPAGENGGWFQTVPMHEITITKATIRAGARPLVFLHDLTISPNAATPARVDAPLYYGGYCAPGALRNARGAIVVCHGTHREGLPSGAEREKAVRAAGAVGILTIADPGFAVEPPRWPYAYARTVTHADAKPDRDPFLRMTLNAGSLGKLLTTVSKKGNVLIRDGASGKPLPSFSLRERFRASFTIRQRDIASPNVVGILPGSDPKLAGQAILLGAHLDGYGYGEPVNGDRLYNGTLDDAAYVALLIRLAERRHGKPFQRPVIFAAWTGEEKGLLGSRWFVAHPTMPLSRIAGVINLDQLRPIFPLKLLTVHGLDDSSLGEDARAVANGLGIAVQNDPEPERNLLRRTDHWPFMQAGIPAVNFVFGYRPGTKSEQIYRQWYRTGYHKPQDDLKQPMDFKAAADFNRFFYKLVERVADDPQPPAWKPTSPLRPR